MARKCVRRVGWKRAKRVKRAYQTWALEVLKGRIGGALPVARACRMKQCVAAGGRVVQSRAMSAGYIIRPLVRADFTLSAPVLIFAAAR